MIRAYVRRSRTTFPVWAMLSIDEVPLIFKQRRASWSRDHALRRRHSLGRFGGSEYPLGDAPTSILRLEILGAASPRFALHKVSICYSENACSWGSLWIRDVKI